jgi:hypothetical protein
MLEKNIRINAWNYLLKKSDINQFKDWFVPATWNVERTEAQSVIDWVNEIKLRLAEFTNGHLDESELREQLVLLLTPLVWYEPQQFSDLIVDAPVWETGSTIPSYNLQRAYQYSDDNLAVTIAENEYAPTPA